MSGDKSGVSAIPANDHWYFGIFVQTSSSHPNMMHRVGGIKQFV
jgi:hypothetical protein